MKRLLLLGCTLFAAYGFSQTTLFQDNFESGSSQWTLNTGSGDNSWVVNNTYLGYPGFIPDTPNQPMSFTNGPQSTYLHITNQSICGIGVCNANFDTGSASNQNAEITTSINAAAYSNVTVSFWYLSAGQTNVSFGTLEYSINGGSTWVSTVTNYVNTSSWTQASVSLPAWNNVAALKFRFKWQNGGGGLDPAFSIDEFIVTGSGSTNSITTANSIMPSSWCFGSTVTVQVNFTSTGTYTAGNVYTAQLSDASGSFASPTSIGTLTSTASGTQMIVGVIPGSTPVGSGYRIRVVSSNPATIGTDNGADLVVHPLPTVTFATLAPLCSNGSPSTLSGGSPAGGSYTGSGVSGGMFNPASGTQTITYTLVDGNGCSNSATQQQVVNTAPTVGFSAIPTLCTIDGPYTLSEGTPAGGTYSGPGVTGNTFAPATAGAGTWSLLYTYTDGNNCTVSMNQSVQVDVCGSISENELIGLRVYPNPANEFITISADVELTQIVLLDVNGRIVKTIDEQGGVNISDLNSGIYFIQLEYNGQRFVERVTVK